ncbi:MAG TPA: TetR/AcrR family transcriptional regulator [Vicinamibacteria bacterium]|jgi:AcrR family transcriptional regulator
MAPPRAPLQKRSQATLDRLIDACEGLLREKPFERVSVGELAKRGRSSVGSFYGRFQGKEELLDFLDARGEKELVERWDEYFAPERWQGVPASELAGRFVRFWVTAHRARKGVVRALHLRLRSRPTRESLARSRRLNRKVIGGMLALLRERRSEIAHPDLDRAVPFALVMAAASIREWILFEDLNLYPSAPDDEALAEELTRAFTAYLGIRRRPRPDRRAGEASPGAAVRSEPVERRTVARTKSAGGTERSSAGGGAPAQ